MSITGRSLCLSLLAICADGAFCDVVIEREDSHQASFQLVAISDPLDRPWSLAFLPDGAPIVSEWPGRLRIIREGRLSKPVKGVPAVLEHDGRTGGLLGIALDPVFERNRRIYLCYLHGTFDSNVSRIARATLSEHKLHDLEVIFEGNDRSNETAHSGCRLTFERDGTLLATFGDRRHLPDEAQHLATSTGTIARLHDDGRAPRNNPFIDHPNAMAQIWAYGVRNVQGIARHPGTGDYWFSEHGPLGGDELNVLRRGANYGWPEATYGIDYDGSVITKHTELEGMAGPVCYWRPSTAPSGLAFYTGKHFPQWRGDLFMGSLAGRRLIRMELDGERVLFQESLLAGFDQRIRDVSMGPGGYLYLLADGKDQPLLRLEPAAP
ncbi:MAG: PQQ-dependent sugar dehydrogenase [Pseudomonadota bacterium]